MMQKLWVFKYQKCKHKLAHMNLTNYLNLFVYQMMQKVWEYLFKFLNIRNVKNKISLYEFNIPLIN